MELGAFLLLGWLVLPVVLVGIAAEVVRRHGASEADRRRRWILRPIGVAVLTWVLFLCYLVPNVIVPSLGETQEVRDYERSSDYGNYRHEMLEFAGPGYVMLAGLLAIAALAARRRDDGLYMPYFVLTCLAVALPIIVPSMLSHG